MHVLVSTAALIVPRCDQGVVVTDVVWSETGSYLVTGDSLGRCVRCSFPSTSLGTNDVRLVLDCKARVVQVGPAAAVRCGT